MSPLRVCAIAALFSAVSSSWVLSWQDDFEGPTLDLTSWNVISSAEGGNQIEYYSPENVFISTVDTVHALTLRTRPENVTVNKQHFNVTSGRVDTSFKRNVTAGSRVEVVARLQNDAASGIHTAHWLLGYGCWPSQAREIDIMECQSPGNAYEAGGGGASEASRSPWQIVTSNYHTGDRCDNETRHSTGTSTYPHASPAFNFTNDWTTYAVEWNATGLVMYVNDTEVNRVYPGMPGWAGAWSLPDGPLCECAGSAPSSAARRAPSRASPPAINRARRRLASLLLSADLILSQAYMAHRPFGDPPAWAWPVLQHIDRVSVYTWAP